MIGIVILNYRNWDDTLRCIQSIVTNPPQEMYQIILVDNASPNGSEFDLKTIIEKYNIVYIQNKKNRGYNAGNNVGIARALELGCDAILISNNDVFFLENSIQKLWEYAKAHPKVGIVGPKILDKTGKIQKSNLCKRTGMKEKYLVRTRLNAIFRREYAAYFGLNRDYNMAFEVYAVLGCCFLMTRDCAQAVTPLDEHPFLYEEELILGIKMEQAGYHTVYYPDAVIEHLHGASTKHVKAFSFAHNVKSEIYYCKAYLKAPNAAIYPLYWYRVGLYLIRCLKYRDFRKNWRWFREMTKNEMKRQVIA